MTRSLNVSTNVMFLVSQFRGVCSEREFAKNIVNFFTKHDQTKNHYFRVSTQNYDQTFGFGRVFPLFRNAKITSHRKLIIPLISGAVVLCLCV